MIYPGKVTEAPCFRIGNIGDLGEEDMTTLLETIKEVLGALAVPLPVA